MKKNVLLLLVLLMLASCGPKRYKCGPNRRCSVEPKHIELKKVPNNRDFSVFV